MTSLLSLLLQLPMLVSLVDCVVVVVACIQLARSRFALASFGWFTSRALACSTSLPLLSRRARLSCHIVACCIRCSSCSHRLLLVFLFNSVMARRSVRWALPPKLQRGGPRRCCWEGDHGCLRSMPLSAHAKTVGCTHARYIHTFIHNRLNLS